MKMGSSSYLLSFYFIMQTLTLCQQTNSSTKQFDDHLMRAKRQINGLPLVFPYGSTFKIIIGLSAPIKNKENINLVFGANFQYQYTQFQNVSEISQYYFIKEVSREEREADMRFRKDERLVFYQALENLLETKGINGQECMLKAICEAAQFPVHEDGLVGEVIHILLTPDYGKSFFELDKDPDWKESMSCYLNAATAGRQMFKCSSVYKDCPEEQGIMELISMLRDE